MHSVQPPQPVQLHRASQGCVFAAQKPWHSQEPEPSSPEPSSPEPEPGAHSLQPAQPAQEHSFSQPWDLPSQNGRHSALMGGVPPSGPNRSPVGL